MFRWKRCIFIYRGRILPLFYFIIDIVLYAVQLDLFKLLSHRLSGLSFSFFSYRLLLETFLQLYLCVLSAHFILHLEKQFRIYVLNPSEYFQGDKVVDKVH
jgi:hypothetical protein